MEASLPPRHDPSKDQRLPLCSHTGCSILGGGVSALLPGYVIGVMAHGVTLICLSFFPFVFLKHYSFVFSFVFYLNFCLVLFDIVVCHMRIQAGIIDVIIRTHVVYWSNVALRYIFRQLKVRKGSFWYSG